MKKITLFIFTLFLFANLYSQYTDYTRYDRTINLPTEPSRGQTRSYMIEVPNDMSTPRPVMFIIHGLMENINDTKSRLSSNRPDWIYVIPQGLVYSYKIVGPPIPIIAPDGITFFDQEIGTAWNCGASGNIDVSQIPIPGLSALGNVTYHINEDLNDVKFLKAVLDSICHNYNVDQDSIFFSGFSLGGFMSNRMGIELGNRINGIASVSGTIGNYFVNSGVITPPSAHLNELHIHGTSDEVIDYATGKLNPSVFNEFFSLAVATIGVPAEAVRDYWRTYNQTGAAIAHTYPDLLQNDEKTFERYYYPNGVAHHNPNFTEPTRTAFIKVVDGTHHWWKETDNADIDCFTEIVKFFRGQWYAMPTTYVPEIDAINVTIDSPVSVTFNQAVTAGVNINGITISPYAGTISSSILGNQLLISHSANFENNKIYTVTIPANAVDNYVSQITWSFTTEEGEPPIVNVSINLTNNFVIYQNPAKNEINIKGTFNNSKLEIYDIVGKKLIETELNNNDNRINISNLQKGAYFIKLEGITEKFFVE